VKVLRRPRQGGNQLVADPDAVFGRPPVSPVQDRRAALYPNPPGCTL